LPDYKALEKSYKVLQQKILDVLEKTA